MMLKYIVSLYYKLFLVRVLCTCLKFKCTFGENRFESLNLECSLNVVGKHFDKHRGNRTRFEKSRVKSKQM